MLLRGTTIWKRLKNNYFQERRWSWGISDDGWIIKQTINLISSRKISLPVLYKASHVILDHIMGPVLSIIILIGGNIPLWVNRPFAGTVLGVNLPQVSSFMIQMTLWFLAFSMALDFFLKPRPPKNTRWRKFTRVIEWAVQPIAGIFLSVLPGLEAHTRLLFGKYLEYYLTKKKGSNT